MSSRKRTRKVKDEDLSSQEEEEEEEVARTVKATRGRKKTEKRAKTGAKPKTKKREIVEEEEEEEEEQEEKEEEEEEEVSEASEEEEEEKPQSKKKEKSRDEEDEEEEDIMLTPPVVNKKTTKKGASKASQANRTQSQSQPAESAKSVENDDDILAPATPTPASIAPTPGTATAPPKPQSGPIRRLIIKKLVCENFKSYAGTQEIGIFHPSFTAVVGPNGSGKSNIFDAMLFVFGYRSNKIRLKKLSELVHHSEAYPNLSQARVSVHFAEILDHDNNNVEDIPGTDIEFSRTVDKTGKSNYYLNGQKMKREEVTEILKEKGIDLDHNRFLILQGEVEQISLMKPKAQNEHEEGMLEYLEDIIGSNKYLPDIEASQKRLEAANEERAEKLGRVKIVEKEKEGLEGAKEEAVEYLQKEVQIYEKKILLDFKRKIKCSEKAKQTEEKKKKLEEELAEKEKELEATKENLSVMEKEYKKHNEELEAIDKEQAETKSRWAVFERKDVKLREDLKHSVAKEKKLQQNIEKEKKKLKEKKMEMKHQEEDVVRLEKEAESLKKPLAAEEAKLEKIYQSLKSETEDLQIELEKKQKELEPWSKKVNEQESALSLLQSELELTVSQEKEAKEKYETSKSRVNEIAATIKERKADIKENPQRIKDTKNKISSATKKLQSLADQEEQALTEIRVSKTKLEDAKSAQTESRGRSKLLQSLTEAKEKKQIVGIHGRLGDLGTISSKYDVAISTACPALENIVVDTPEVGAKCLDLLREKNLGRATFILLSEINHLRNKMNTAFTAPEGAPRLFDLVKPKVLLTKTLQTKTQQDEQYRTAFYFALGDTLVAKDLEQATRIAYSENTRYRVVTLEGQLIDTSGTMSGGGNQVSRGGMSSTLAGDSISKEEMAKLEKSIEQTTNKLAKIREEKQAVETEIQELNELLSQLEVDVKKAEMDVSGLAKQKEELEALLPKLAEEAASTKSDKAKVKELEKKIEKSAAELAKSSGIANKLGSEVQELQNRILDIGGVKLKAQKAKVESLAEQIDTATRNATKTQVQHAAAIKQVEKIKKAIEEAEAELEKAKENTQKLKADLKQLEIDAQDVADAYNKGEELKQQKVDEMAEIKQNYEKAKKINAKARSRQADIVNQLDDIKKLADDAQHEYKQATRKISELYKKKQALLFDLSSDVEPPADSQQEPQEPSEEELERYETAELKKDISILEDELKSMKPNMAAIQQYKKKEKEYQERVKILDEVTEKRDQERKTFETLRKKRLDEFMAGFTTITMKLKEMYQMITLGGDAELELVDSLDPFSEGIVFSVRPPKKSWKNISNLSGGEKTLSSLALVFALHHYKPTPLYVMDEIDAALDFKNVSIVANYIKERTKNAQFIIISLRNNMFELADRLVGIYKTKDCTKSVTINPNQFVIPAPQTALRPTSANAQNSQPSQKAKKTTSQAPGSVVVF